MKTLVLFVPKSLVVQSLQILSRVWKQQQERWRPKLGPPLFLQAGENRQTLAEKNGLVLRDRRELGLK